MNRSKHSLAVFPSTNFAIFWNLSFSLYYFSSRSPFSSCFCCFIVQSSTDCAVTTVILASFTTDPPAFFISSRGILHVDYLPDKLDVPCLSSLLWWPEECKAALISLTFAIAYYYVNLCRNKTHILDHLSTVPGGNLAVAFCNRDRSSYNHYTTGWLLLPLLTALSSFLDDVVFILTFAESTHFIASP